MIYGIYFNLISRKMAIDKSEKSDFLLENKKKLLFSIILKINRDNITNVVV
jgi:hypothetical protein